MPYLLRLVAPLMDSLIVQMDATDPISPQIRAKLFVLTCSAQTNEMYNKNMISEWLRKFCY